MKHFIKIALVCFAAACIVSACRPAKFKEIGEIPSKTKGIQGSWLLSHAYVVDDAYVNPDQLDITDFYKTKALPSFTFTETNFTALTTGTVKNYFGTGTGTWSFDNNDYPTTLYFTYSNNDKDTFLLGATIRPTDSKLKLKKTYFYTKNGIRKSAYSYIWEFDRQ
jgi:hypothetical protein